MVYRFTVLEQLHASPERLRTEVERCTLDGTRVRGNITVESGASLVARRVRVTGKVQAEGARAVSAVGLDRQGRPVRAAVRTRADRGR